MIALLKQHSGVASPAPFPTGPASLASLMGGLNHMSLDGSPTRVVTSRVFMTKDGPSMSAAPKDTKAGGATDDTFTETSSEASKARQSFESSTTLVGGAPPLRKNGTRAGAGAGAGAEQQQQQRREEAKPLAVSDDVQAILSGRMRAGGLQMGGEPLRVTGKGKASVPGASSSNVASATTPKNTRKDGNIFTRWANNKHQ